MATSFNPRAALFAALSFPVASLAASDKSCRVLPGDSAWPSAAKWKALNTTVGGRLSHTVPIGSPCHDPTYDAAECDKVKAEFGLPAVHYEDPASVMNPIFLNGSCDPFAPEDTPCTIGNYVQYSVHVSNAEDARTGLKFAQENNVRLVVKNTGHDYFGKSTGKGALGLWTHNLKQLSFIQTYQSKGYAGYNGPAIKMGAGVQAFEAYTFADKNKVRIIGGTCTSVGLAGGYYQGGGHGPLASEYGLGSDQVLEWEVVTATGKHLTATPKENSDLYWALSGGGGGTYALVLSMTIKAHADSQVGGAFIQFASTGLGDTYWNMIGEFHKLLPSLVDTGAMAAYKITAGGFGLGPLTAPGKTGPETVALLQPWIDTLTKNNVKFSLKNTTSPTYLQHMLTYFGPFPDGKYPAATLTGGRLIPRSLVLQNNDKLTDALKKITEGGVFYMGVLGLNVNHTVANNTPSTNAVLPAWREALMSVLVVADWNFTQPLSHMQDVANEMTDRIVPYLEDITPGGGTYLNEGDFQLETWKEDFYGPNYNKLLSIKNKYDPKHIFYGKTAVGSDAWKVEADGRLCAA